MKKILTIDEVAEYLKIHTKTLYRLVAKNEIPCFKVSGTWRFTQEGIDRYIDEQSESENKVTRKKGKLKKCKTKKSSKNNQKI